MIITTVLQITPNRLDSGCRCSTRWSLLGRPNEHRGRLGRACVFNEDPLEALGSHSSTLRRSVPSRRSNSGTTVEGRRRRGRYGAEAVTPGWSCRNPDDRCR